MRIKLNSIVAIAAVFLMFSCTGIPESPELISPDGNLKMSLKLDEGSELSYGIWIKQDEQWKQIIEDSPLGIIRNDADFSQGLKISGISERKIFDEEYKLVARTSDVYRNFYAERSFNLENQDGKKLDLVCRAYNGAAAFRYVFPGKDTVKYEVSGEITAFNLPEEGKAWLQPYDTVVWWAPAYEQFFMDGIDVGTPAPENKNGWCFPMLFQTGEYWVYISEAGLSPSYCGCHIEQNAPEGIYSIRFPEPNEAYNYFPQNPQSKLPWKMPWRYIVINKNPGAIMNSAMVTNLAEAPETRDINWIKPGVSSWSWWSENESPRDFIALKEFVDFASDMGWEYSLVDAGWDEMQGGDIEELVDYAKKKNVGILLWYDSGSRIDYIKGNPQSEIMFHNESREEEMRRIADMGVKGVKIDFFQSDKQGIIKLYHDILEDAARNKLMVNFHGCTMPRGWSRTYPHLMTMEAIKGGEAYRFSEEYTDYGAKHNTIIPFTRNVAGPMDYTPVTLTDAKYPHKTTTAHELALGVVFHSGIQHFADHWKKYSELDKLAKEYLKDVPVGWDESVLLSGYPGKDVVLARRNGKDWFIAGINGEDKEKDITIKLDFLPPGSFDFITISDGDSRDDINTERRVITREEEIQFRMKAKGGFCAKTGLVKPLN